MVIVNVPGIRPGLQLRDPGCDPGSDRGSDPGWIRQFTAASAPPDRWVSLGYGFGIVASGPGALRSGHFTGIVVPAGIGTAVTLFFALPVATRSL
ncbi:hypothetical protein PBS_64570 [Paraburkholderia sp. 2C]